jgi:hypothetical protein
LSEEEIPFETPRHFVGRRVGAHAGGHRHEPQGVDLLCPQLRRLHGSSEDLLSGHPRYPIEVEFYDDAEWQMWSKTVKGLKARGV